MRSRIMVIGRDVALRSRLARLLSGAGYRVEIAESPPHARRVGFDGADLAIVALDGFGSEGKALLQELRAAVGTVLPITAPGHEHELRSDALDVADEAGLLARVAQALARAPNLDLVEPVLRFEGYRLDLAGHSLQDRTGSEVPLTRGEFSLLRAFARRPGRVLSRDQLLRMLAGHPAEAYDRTIDMQIVRLRRKIEFDPKRPHLIVTIPGSGYKFSAAVTTEAIGAPDHPGTTAPPPNTRSTPERQLLTIMQCALVGPTFLSAQGDPEDLHRLLAGFHDRCTAVIVQAGGTVARLLNDGVLAYFGYPQADEHQAERAVRAALSLIHPPCRIEIGNADDIHICIGIATGPVVVGSLFGTSGEHAALGEPARLAAGLLAHAERDTALISAATQRLVGALFECESHQVALDGFAEPVPVWQIIGEGVADNRFEALHGQDVVDLVGRDEDLALLLRRWEQAKAADGCVVLISGEPGIGKSRVVKAIQECIGGEPHTHLQYFCSPHHQGSAFYPIITHLGRAAGFRREDTTEQRLSKLEAMLSQATTNISETAPLLADLLSIPTANRYPPLNLSPPKRKERTLAALLTQVEGRAVREPALMIFEDVHWADPTTREALDLMVDRARALPMLLIITFRPEFGPSWIGQPHVTLLTMNRLRPREGAEMIAHVAGGKALPGEIVNRILDRSDGVPLFIEELTKAILESGSLTEGGEQFTLASPIGPLAIPSTLHASLLARLDRLAPTREVAQIGAALGRQFSHELISAVAQMQQQAVDEALARLAGAEIIFRRGTPPDAEYTFKHALVQDAAYDTLLKSQRQKLHARIAHVLEVQFPEVAEQQPELLAQHCCHAELHERAVEYWLKASQQAMARSAIAEAVSHLHAGLDLLLIGPENPKSQQQELDLQIALGSALILIRGYTDPIIGETYSRARHLCEKLGQNRKLPLVIFGEWSFHVLRGELVSSLGIVEDLLSTAKSQDDAGVKYLSHSLYLRLYFVLGAFAEARAHGKQAINLYNPAHRDRLTSLTAEDPQCVTLVYSSLLLVSLGCFDQAEIHLKEALSDARAGGQAHVIAYAACQASIYDILLRSPESLSEHSEEILLSSANSGSPFWEAWGTFFRGYSLAQFGRPGDGIGLMKKSTESIHAMGMVCFRPFCLMLLAEVHGAAGLFGEGLQWLAEATNLMAITQERWLEAEIYRVRGELLRKVGDETAAQKSFDYGLAVAQRQGAKLWEMRTALSVARFWRELGKGTEARDLICPIYSGFIEGFDTPDLKDARALLGELT